MKNVSLRRGCAVVVLSLLVAGGCSRKLTAEEHVERAQAALAKFDHGTALIELHNAVELEPGNAGAVVALIDTYLDTGNAVAARQQLDRAGSAGVAPESLQTLEVRTLFQEGRMDDLLARVPAGAARPPQERALRAQALLSQNQVPQARAELEALVADAPESEDAMLALVDAIRIQQGAAAALAHLNRVAKSPASARIEVMKGDLQLAVGNVVEGERTLSGVAGRVQELSDPRGQAYVWARLAEARLSLGDLAGSKQALDALEEITGESPPVIYGRARLKSAEGDKRGALEYAQRLVQADPENPNALLLMGTLNADNQAYDTAAMYLERAARVSPTNPTPRKMLARMFLSQERWQPAADSLVPLIEQGMADSETLSLYAYARSRAGEKDPIPDLVRRIEASPSSPERDLSLVNAYLVAARPQEALAVLNARKEWGTYRRRSEFARIVVAYANDRRAVPTDTLDAALAEESTLPEDYLTAAQVLQQTGSTERARVYLDRGVARFPTDRSLAITRARLDLESGAGPAAEARLAELVKRDGTFVDAWTLYARAARERGDYPTAIARLEQAVAIDPKAVQPRLELAQVLLIAGQRDKADKVLADGVALSPGNAALLMARGDLDLARGNSAKALDSYGLAGKADPNNASVALKRAQAQLAAGQLDAARVSVEQALSMRPGWWPALALRVSLDVREKRFAEATRVLDSLDARAQEAPEALVLRAEILAAQNKGLEAAALIDKAVALRPDGRLALRAYQLRRDAGDPKALSTLQSALAASPNDVSMRLAVAEALTSAGDRRGAISVLEEGARRLPTNPLILNNLAWAYFEAGDAKALSTAEQAVRYGPGLAPVQDTVGWILYNAGRAEDAIQHLRAAQQLTPADGDVAYHLAAALLKTGRASEARDVLAPILATSRQFASRKDAERLLDAAGPVPPK